MERELLTVPEVRSKYGFPRDWLYDLIRTGAIPVLGNKRRFLIPRRAIEELLDAKVAESRKVRGALGDHEVV